MQHITITETQLNEQLELEAHMRGWGAEIATSKVHKAEEKGRLSTTDGAQAVIRKLLEPYVVGSARGGRTVTDVWERWAFRFKHTNLPLPQRLSEPWISPGSQLDAGRRVACPRDGPRA